mmetsp:Transcript_3380/g.11885  ORF Transcript_3380/g.11885 Transcript_3380/m.11885 type:complete len:390 (-) Transcript_3380:256-1425(-)
MDAAGPGLQPVGRCLSKAISFSHVAGWQLLANVLQHGDAALDGRNVEEIAARAVTKEEGISGQCLEDGKDRGIRRHAVVHAGEYLYVGQPVHVHELGDGLDKEGDSVVAGRAGEHLQEADLAREKKAFSRNSLKEELRELCRERSRSDDLEEAQVIVLCLAAETVEEVEECNGFLHRFGIGMGGDGAEDWQLAREEGREVLISHEETCRLAQEGVDGPLECWPIRPVCCSEGNAVVEVAAEQVHHAALLQQLLRQRKSVAADGGAQEVDPVLLSSGQLGQHAVGHHCPCDRSVAASHSLANDPRRLVVLGESVTQPLWNSGEHVVEGLLQSKGGRLVHGSAQQLEEGRLGHPHCLRVTAYSRRAVQVRPRLELVVGLKDATPEQRQLLC